MTLAFDHAGTGSAIVLLHSSVCDRRMWDKQWQSLLGAGYQVVRCDFRGHGDTPAPIEPYNAAEDVVEVLDQLGLGAVTLVGASYGGRVAQEIASRWPHRVTKLGLVCAAADFPPTDAIKAFGSKEDELLEAGDVLAATQLNVDTFAGPRASDETRAFIAEMQQHAFELQLAVADYPPSRKADFSLKAITAKTTVVKGLLDVDYFQLIADMLVTEIPDAQLVTLPWAGHLPSLEDPEQFAPVLQRLVSEG
ncbi:alpha/beta fold hydrolase [Catelliglobosispora koreensis]|uniref:alpha/beta fold hydrolase n=1 Tax=Catelliglobosispora koreensis TaxID=129052 RepID=UPI0003631B51|nr:alpha/beta hydrolase [Catelliglobosispora koreensis]